MAFLGSLFAEGLARAGSVAASASVPAAAEGLATAGSMSAVKAVPVAAGIMGAGATVPRIAAGVVTEGTEAAAAREAVRAGVAEVEPGIIDAEHFRLLPSRMNEAIDVPNGVEGPLGSISEEDAWYESVNQNWDDARDFVRRITPKDKWKYMPKNKYDLWAKKHSHKIMQAGSFGALGGIGAAVGVGAKKNKDKGQEKRDDDAEVPALFRFNPSGLTPQNMSALQGVAAHLLLEDGTTTFLNEAKGFEVNGTMTEGNPQGGIRRGRLSVPMSENSAAEGYWFTKDLTADDAEAKAEFDNVHKLISSALDISTIFEVLDSLVAEGSDSGDPEDPKQAT